MANKVEINLLVTTEQQLRNGWWILIFFVVLASMLIPILLLAQQHRFDVTVGIQAVIIVICSCVCQWLHRKPLADLSGEFNTQWWKDLCLGGWIGSMLMIIPALILGIFGWVDWQWSPVDLSVLSASAILFVEVAVAEELLFRGFVFQRLISSLGPWPAQLIVAAFFLLTHLNNPGMTGSVRIMASINIFLASIMFGLAYTRTNSLAMPLGLHFMANWIQGGVLGFGVSGTNQLGLLGPGFGRAPAWLTGSEFGLEASALGVLSIVLTLILFARTSPRMT